MKKKGEVQKKFSARPCREAKGEQERKIVKVTLVVAAGPH